MSKIMQGTDVAKAMKEELIIKAEELKQKGMIPALAIVRVGARPDDLAYERGARKRMELVGIACKVIELPEDIGQEELERAFSRVNADPDIHGILLFQPLPGHLDVNPVKAMIDPWKDVDGMSPVNIAKVFAGDETGFAPCTAEAVMEMLRYYGIGFEGKRVTVVGRSMVVGRPLAMLLLREHATVTICHTRTARLEAECQNAGILVAAAGKARMITGEMIREGAVVADVGINVDEDGKLCGDVDFDSIQDTASMATPVPGGVGAVTTAVLAKHLVQAALRKYT